MKVENLEFEGLKLISLDIFSDDRGYFVERFNAAKFRELGIPSDFVQDNNSRSHPKVLRGLHIQYSPNQAKLISTIRGRIWDVAVDLRKNSKTFLKHYAIELSAENGKVLFIPHGFAHGFCVLGDEPADVLYKTDAFYNPKGEAGILWNDKELGIKWPIQNPIVSERDKKLLSLKSALEVL